MKQKRIISTSLSIMLLSLIFFSTQAQNRKGNQNRPDFDQRPACLNIPNLTEDQEDKIEDLRVEHMRNMMDYRNELAAKKVELRKLETAEKADMKAIESVIDEISVIKAKMMKEHASHRQDIRKILTEKQRVYFDAHAGGAHGPMRGGKAGPGGKRPQGRGFHQGDCPYR